MEREREEDLTDPNAYQHHEFDDKGNEDSRKFRLSWLGPYTIIARKGEVVYDVRHDSSGKVETVHEDRLKLTYESKIARRAMAKEAAKDNSQPVTGRQLRSGYKGKQRGDQVSKWWDEKEKVNTDYDSSSDEEQTNTYGIKTPKTPPKKLHLKAFEEDCTL